MIKGNCGCNYQNVAYVASAENYILRAFRTFKAILFNFDECMGVRSGICNQV